MGYPMHPPVSAPQLQLVTEESKQASFNWFPFVEPLTALNRELRQLVHPPTLVNPLATLVQMDTTMKQGPATSVAVVTQLVAPTTSLSWHQGNS